MRYLLLFFLLFSGSLFRVHAETIPADTSKVEVREFDKGTIDKLKEDKAYNYESGESFLQRWWKEFWRWLWSLLEKDVEKIDKVSKPNIPNPAIFNVIIILVIIVLVILGLTKVKFRNWITGKSAKVINEYELEEENIHEIDFDHDLHQAEQEEDYRRAIRLRFLKILKLLTDAGKIHWEINKTNHEYRYELKDENIKEDFVACVDIFDRVWYGELPIDRNDYLDKKTLFESMTRKVTGNKKPGNHG